MLPTNTENASISQRSSLQWWQRFIPVTQDRQVVLGPLISVFLFLAAIISAFWYLNNEEHQREVESVKLDTEIVQQLIRLRLQENQEALFRIAREVKRHDVSDDDFFIQTSKFLRSRQEVVAMTWQLPGERKKTPKSLQRLLNDKNLAPWEIDKDADDKNDNVFSNAKLAFDWISVSGQEANQQAFETARQSQQSVYSKVFTNERGLQVIQLHTPLINKTQFLGTLVTEYSLDTLLRLSVPEEMSSRRFMSFVQMTGQSITVSNLPNDRIEKHTTFIHEMVVTPIGSGLLLRGEGYKTSSGLIGNTLFWVVMALSILTVWTLISSLQQMLRRSNIQRELVKETNFRRAMENSISTGMRAIDLTGCITYVNRAFCEMTGFSEDQLVGCKPPYPYWPEKKREELNHIFKQELSGRSPFNGVELLIQRQDKSVFDARMYVSPLINPQGEQTGWMASITNITDAKRIRDQLSASHERFTTVLEGLDAAVSVISVQKQALLFANRTYRLWFGGNPDAHLQLTGEEKTEKKIIDLEDWDDNFGGLPTKEIMDAGSDLQEVYIERLNKWFDVRARYIQWTDGRLAQMLIATDVTERRLATEASSRQAEKAQFTSRLITMGEMASTLAHELNQPLAAISNYCSGIISRIQTGVINNEDLIAALVKTSNQAQRAGQVLHRIRHFVKRSEPQRQEVRVKDITDAVIDLASFEMKRRRVTLNVVVGQYLPTIHVDPILIEQVLLNLLKNSAEAIDNANVHPSRRMIDLRATIKQSDHQGRIMEFSVTDGGPGIEKDVLDKLFTPFSSNKADGLGIGLSLCRSIIETHRGTIKAENIYNQEVICGCIFTFSFPIEDAVT